MLFVSKNCSLEKVAFMNSSCFIICELNWIVFMAIVKHFRVKMRLAFFCCANLIFHLVSVFYITAHLVNIILEMQLTLISARRATDCCRSPLLVAFEIPGVGFHRLRSLSNWLSIIELHKGIFCLRIH